ncbi:hypothetical protein PIROE2DRAFT_6359 [Piromyces sp. E2]|nr:hypothetical protein PIROE2DRAFT_6359 [Piromyces sp. E2]|eukprot:OUM66414.1 hypothetical protein PIROE2DRAFT_6359 [Piromyces sp. E2]
MVKLSFKNSVKNTLLFVATFLVLNNNVNAYTYTKNAVKFSDKEISNPYIGWFHGAVTIDLNDYPKYDCNYVSTFAYVRDLKKTGLQYLGVRLAEFNNRNISNNALTALRNLLEEYRKKRKEDPTLQIILRFYYDGVNNYKSDPSTYKPLKKSGKRRRSNIPNADTTSDSSDSFDSPDSSDSNTNSDSFDSPDSSDSNTTHSDYFDSPDTTDVNTTHSDSDGHREFIQLDNRELYLTSEGYKYFKQEYDPDILNFRNSTISDFGVEQDSGNVSNKNEEITKIKYYDSKVTKTTLLKI